MNIIDIIIGRDADSGKLRIVSGGKSMTAGDANSVPASISREHVQLTVSDQGIIVVRNINIENSLYVNRYVVESKRITYGDCIELGYDRYHLQWDILDKLFRIADIRPLEQVWKDYQAQRMKLQIKERRFGVLRSATGILTTAAMILSFMEIGGGAANSLRLILYGSSFAVTLIFFILAWRSASRIPLQQQQLEETTRRRYCCPECGSLFNLQSYDLLRQMKKCPHCGAIFIK